MGSGDFRKHEKKKVSKADLEKKANKQMGYSAFSLPQVQIIKKGKKDAA